MNKTEDQAMKERELTCRAGETIFRQGETGKTMYLLLEGTVEVTVDSNGMRLPVAKFMSGDFFGEMSLLEGLPRSGTAVAAEPSRLLPLDEEAFRERMAADGAFAWRITKALSSRIRNHNQELIREIGVDLQEISAQLGENARGIHRGIEEIAASAGEIETNQKRLAEQIRDVQLLSKQIVSTLAFIQRVAMQTQILGLNAGIEASRSGEFGRGFLIIAEEIRKLSVQSKENAEKIEELTGRIGLKIGGVAEASEDSARRSNEQALATRELVASAGDVTMWAQKLNELALKLKA